jgi:hypothetical protein
MSVDAAFTMDSCRNMEDWSAFAQSSDSLLENNRDVQQHSVSISSRLTCIAAQGGTSPKNNKLSLSAWTSRGEMEST